MGACAASAFDATYYAETNPDVAAACGTDEASLLRHYLSSGQAEGRKPSARGKAGDSLKLTNEQIALVWSPVPLKDLANYKSLKKKMTDEQYQACLLYTSDAADEEDSGDLGGRRMLQKKKKEKKTKTPRKITEQKVDDDTDTD